MSDQPLKLHDGTLVFKDGRVVKPSAPITVEAAADTVERNIGALVLSVHKKLSDLPETPRVMNGMAAVLGYTLYGLSDDDIASVMRVPVERVEAIRQMDSYNTLRVAAIANVLDAEQGDIRELFVKHARAAVGTIVQGLQAGKAADRLRAASDILDRSGHRPADVVEHRHRMEGGLTIEVVRKTDSAPVIDMDMED